MKCSLLLCLIILVFLWSCVEQSTSQSSSSGSGSDGAKDDDVRMNKLLSEVVFLQTHDSMTGEFDDKRDYIMTKLAKTQEGSIVDQLECGARALDYRPFYTKDGQLFAHHGPIVVHKSMKETFLQMQEWGRLHPTELIVVSLSHCVTERFHNNYYAEQCYDAALRVLSDLNVHTITDCDDLVGLTYSSALSKYGNILAVWGCGFGYWDPSITCYGISEDKSPFACYETKLQPPNNIQIPWAKLTSFLETNTAQLPSISAGTFWSIGGNWQSSVESDTLAIMHNSSLILDEVRSEVNKYLARSISENKFKYLNMLGVDNICDHGLDIVKAINTYYYSYSSSHGRKYEVKK